MSSLFIGSSKRQDSQEVCQVSTISLELVGCRVSSSRSLLRRSRNSIVSRLVVVGPVLLDGIHLLSVSRRFHRLVGLLFSIGRRFLSSRSSRCTSRNLSSRSRWIVGFRFSCAETRKVDSKCQSVSYTHLRAPRDLSTSRMPSSA